MEDNVNKKTDTIFISKHSLGLLPLWFTCLKRKSYLIEIELLIFHLCLMSF